MFESISLLLILGSAFAFSILAVFFFFRRVVATNEVHIVQSSKTTTSYGKDSGNGNTYYEWPSWIPVFGVSKMVLPVSVFDLDLHNYEAYDKGRLPFVVDVKAFFRISDSNIAAQRVASFGELNNQLIAIVQGAVRTILASSDIEEIMQGRSKFGSEFTKEVEGELPSWGVMAVKNIELMDIRDSGNSKVIFNIMEKKKSLIEMESRQEVAKNSKVAKIAEIEASREVELQNQQAKQMIGLRTVEANRQVEIAKQEADQLVKEQEKNTKEKEMAITKVAEVRKAEIEKEVKLVQANQEKETTIVVAEGKLESKKREAQAITAEGEAKAQAEKAMQLAPVEAQIVLAKEIGGNESYQKYLITIEQVKANQLVGMEQAKAIAAAEIKIIANSDGITTGFEKVTDLFSSKGGQNIGSMLEGFKNTDVGQKIVEKILN
jgi:flotillin